MTSPSLPKHHDFYRPTLQAIDTLGGSGSIEEIDDAVITLTGIKDEQLGLTYQKSGALVVPDRLSWARSYLKAAGLIHNPRKGVWVLSEEGRRLASLSPSALKKEVDIRRKQLAVVKQVAIDDGGEADEPSEPVWNDQLLSMLLQLSPDAFERLCQRILRESGFTRVEVTGKSGDGGIDGAGVLRMNLISFQVLFQCKRWKSSVGSEVVRNFRGAMQGRADKGLIITTGTFTVEARKEATRDGAPAIDLIDGESLCLLMKELSLGLLIKEVRVEEILVDNDFFARL